MILWGPFLVKSPHNPMVLKYNFLNYQANDYWCGGLKENRLQRPIGSAAFKKCSFVEESVSLEVGSEVSDGQAGLFSADQDAGL